MTVFQRCNYAGPLGNLIPTRSFIRAFGRRLRRLMPRLRRRR